MTTTGNAIARRNTAVLTESLVATPVLNLLREQVPDGAMIFSFDPSDRENEPLVFRTDANGTREWEQHVEHPFGLVNWAAKRIALENGETKESVPAIRVVLIDAEGETISFVSIGIVASLDLIRTLRGDGPYDPPIPVVFEAIRTRGGFKTLKMRPVATPATKQAKK